MRICFVQFGDFRAAAKALGAGGDEAYYAQRYSVEFVNHLARNAEAVAVVCVDSEWYEETLPSGVITIGLPLWRAASMRDLVSTVDRQRPTRLIVRFPCRPLLAYGVRRGIATLPLLADSFNGHGLRDRWQYWRLSRILRTPRIPWVANHNVAASRSLAALGVDPAKIVPWDWPPEVRPSDFTPKIAPPRDGPFRLFYVGHLTEAKGLGDCLEALRLLRAGGVNATLTVAGNMGEPEAFRARAITLGLAPYVQFLGAVPHRQVVPLMRDHDAVLVASRPEYPEGLPMTIYEALASRTPLIVSSHPMFLGAVQHGQSALVFDAGNATALASQVRHLIESPELYSGLSHASAQAWETIQCPVTWGELLTRWLSSGSEDRGWLARHALAAQD